MTTPCGTPQRIQRQRTRGWRMPVDAIYVGRPSRWGNPITLSLDGIETSSDAARMFDRALTLRESIKGMLDAEARATELALVSDYPTVDQIRKYLAGRDLACWCPLDQPCHADVLLELANSGEVTA